jgi:aminocarboxymuconate-semialdehyde decarboxylase
MDELSKTSGYARVERDEHKRLLVHYKGDYNIVVGPHIDIDARLKAMDRCGIDMHVLTLTTPSVERETPERGIKLSQLANDGFRDVINDHPDRFQAFAALPLQAPRDAADELERSVKDLGLKGGTLMTNVNGKPLDLEEFYPIYERAVKLDVPLFIHPTSPINSKWMEDWRLVPIIGFGIDTSLNILRFVFSGLLDKMPKLKVIASHLGGIFPYLRGRVEIGYKAYPECKININEPPSTYLRKIWMDSIIYDEDILMSTLAFSGSDKLLLGSDHPHQIGDMAQCIGRIKKLDISEEDKERILWKNAAKLLKL